MWTYDWASIPTLRKKIEQRLKNTPSVWSRETQAGVCVEALQKDPGFWTYDKWHGACMELSTLITSLCVPLLPVRVWKGWAGVSRVICSQEETCLWRKPVRNSIFGRSPRVLPFASERYIVKCFCKWVDLFIGLIAELENMESSWPLAFIFACNSRSSHILPNTSLGAQANKASIYVIILL